MRDTPTIHASAVLIGARAVLIRGPSGSGKSRLAYALIDAGRSGVLPFARLVADDRAHVDVYGGRLLVRPAPALAGLIEVRGLGIRRLAFEPLATVGLVIDLSADDAGRHPAAGEDTAKVTGISLPRLAVAAEIWALPLVLAWATSERGGD
jgi:HPr kinase/phosphorylase